MTPFPTPANLDEAKTLQRTLAQRVQLTGDPQNIRYLAALDASIKENEDLVAAAVLWDRHTGQALEVAFARLSPAEVFPYISGFLSFREAPVYLAALAQLSTSPEILLVDGQGIAHPRGLGIAAHLGVHLDMPAIGIAKNRLYGREEGVLEPTKGSAVPLMGRSQVGWVYRSRDNTLPLYVSPGHKVGMQEALEFTRSLPGKTKHPEPLRLAHHYAGRGRKEALRGTLVLP